MSTKQNEPFQPIMAMVSFCSTSDTHCHHGRPGVLIYQKQKQTTTTTKIFGQAGRASIYTAPFTHKGHSEGITPGQSINKLTIDERQ